MAVTEKAQLKSSLATGQKPTGDTFANLIDSAVLSVNGVKPGVDGNVAVTVDDVVLSVNGQKPGEDGNVVVTVNGAVLSVNGVKPGEGGNVAVDISTLYTQNNALAGLDQAANTKVAKYRTVAYELTMTQAIASGTSDKFTVKGVKNANETIKRVIVSAIDLTEGDTVGFLTGHSIDITAQDGEEFTFVLNFQTSQGAKLKLVAEVLLIETPAGT